MSDNLYDEKEKTKLERLVGDSFASEVARLQNKQLEEKLLALAKYEQEIITSKNNDDELIKARQHIKFLNEPYRDSLKLNKAKARLIALTLQERTETNDDISEDKE